MGDRWKDAAGKISARQLVIGFLILAAAVFAAQLLATWLSRSSDLAAMERAKQRADRDVAFQAAVADGWKRAVPCLNQRMTEVMRQLSTSQPVDPALLKRPAMESGMLQLPSDTQQRLMIDRYGEDRAQDYWAASQNVTRLSDSVTDIIRSWSGFALVDSDNGTVGERDRHQARMAASGVKAALRGLEITADNIIGRAEAIGVKPDSRGEFRAIRDCDDLWRNGMTHPNPDMK